MISDVSLFTPSNKLMSKSLSVGHAIFSYNGLPLPVANLSAVPVWLDKGSTLGTIQPYMNDVVTCDFTEQSTLRIDQDDESDGLTREQMGLLQSLETQINLELPSQDKATLMALL
jgi:hypothetical protein